MSFLNVVSRNIFYRIVNTVCLLLITIELSRLLTVKGYGILSLLIANATIFNLLSSFGSDSAITYYSSSRKIALGKVKVIVVLVLLIQLFLFTIVELVFFKTKGYFLLSQTSDLKYGWIGFSFFLSVIISDKYIALLNGRHLYITANKMVLLANLGLLISLAIASFYKAADSTFFLIGLYTLFNLAQAIFLAWSYHKLVCGIIDIKELKKTDVRMLFSYSFIVYFTNSIQFLAYRIDYWFINYYWNKAELGWYSLAVRISQLFWVIPALLASIIFPIVSSNQIKYRKEEMLSLIRIMNVFNFLSGAAVFISAQWLLPLIFGNKYMNSVHLIYILLPGIFLFCITTILAAYFAGVRKLMINFWGSLICFVVVLTLDLLLVPGLGMTGAAIASSLAYSLTTFYFMFLFCFQTKTPILDLLVFKKDDWKIFERELEPQE